MTADPDQLDLFGERQDEIDWTAVFERTRVEVVIDAELNGFAKGSTHLAWKCPSCGELELTPYMLRINHGFDPECQAVSRPIDDPCIRNLNVRLDKSFHPTTEETL